MEQGKISLVKQKRFPLVEVMHRFLPFFLFVLDFVHVVVFLFLKCFDSIEFFNCIYFSCHKAIGQPKVKGGEGTARLYKSNRLNSDTRNIKH